MPFGAAFAVLFFAVLTPAVGAAFLSFPGRPARALAALAVAGGWAVALGLISRQRWSRWAGIAGAALTALISASLVAARSVTVDHLVLLAAASTLVLLLIPATGRLTPRPSRFLGTVLGVIAVCALAAEAGLWAALDVPGVPHPPAPRRAASAASADRPAPDAPADMALRADAQSEADLARGSDTANPSEPDPPRSVEWSSDYAGGIQKAKSEGKPVFLTFYTSWCGYCRKMDQTTFRNPAVVRELSDMVAVRVDAEAERGNPSGSELAARYRVGSFPTLVYLDASGRVVLKASGYMAPRMFLLWLKSGRSRAAMQGSS